MKHKIAISFCTVLSFGCLCNAQDSAFRSYDYSVIGLQFNLPSNWTHDGLSTTTKAAFIKQFGWIYDKPDAEDIWHALGSFSHIAVDSTLLPSDAAYSLHSLMVLVNRANTLYKRWLCLYQRTSLFERRPIVGENHVLTLDSAVGPYDLPAGLPDAKGRSFEFYTKQFSLPTTGYVFNFIHQDKCFEIRVEGTTANLPDVQTLQARIMDSFRLIPF